MGGGDRAGPDGGGPASPRRPRSSTRLSSKPGAHASRAAAAVLAAGAPPQLQVDITSETEASAAAASDVVSIVEIERRFGDPERYGTADIEPCAWVAADLKRRPHVVLKGHAAANVTPSHRSRTMSVETDSSR